MSNFFKYKGYVGMVEIDTNEGLFHGRVKGLRDVISFVGDSYEELENAFRESVDDYLEFCDEIGKQPDKEFSGKIPLRTSATIHREIYIKSTSKGMSINQWIETAILKDLHPEDAVWGGQVGRIEATSTVSTNKTKEEVLQ